MTDPTSAQPTELPTLIRSFLDAHAARDVGAAIKAFGADAVVTDQGQTFRGTHDITRFLSESGAEFSYTTELLGSERTEHEEWVAINRITGNFPGGAADLRYRFTMSHGLISELHIGA